MNRYITEIDKELQQRGYRFDRPAEIPGRNLSWYYRSTERIRLGFAKVDHHFLFIDWDGLGFNRSKDLIEQYEHFSRSVNQGYRTPHALRMTVPNLAIIPVTQKAFPAEVINFARTEDLVPWYGGEVGQVILVDIPQKQVVSLVSLQGGSRYPKPGALLLGYAATLIRQISKVAFNVI